ncbi:MRP-L47-domain-containing protein [Meredithblackwellia eburnea MCA 4105]
MLLNATVTTTVNLVVKRTFTSAVPAFAASTSQRPKRDETAYGIPQAKMTRANWPKKEDTDTSNHPLWRFFHDKQSLEVPDKRKDNSGRSWSSFELRRKSFEDLHTLWYVLLRERNVLLTQREEARRLRLDLRGFTSHPERLRMVQKSMARTKQVLSERRHAAIQAAQLLRERGDFERAEKIEGEAEKMEPRDS